MFELEKLPALKRERLRKQEKLQKIQELRASLPKLTGKDIRNFRLPYHEALMQDLIDAGFTNTPEFIKQLIQLQDQLRENNEVERTRPKLSETSPVLDHLSTGLKQAEKYHNEANYRKEWNEFLELAANYAFVVPNWGWLGEQLLLQCSEIANRAACQEFSKEQATTYYLIGKFYLKYKAEEMEAAISALSTARKIAYEQSWNANKLLKLKQDTIFMECCRLLYEASIEDAKNMMYEDPKHTIELCNLARKRAAEACFHQGEFEAFVLKGNCELNQSDVTEAIISYRNSLSVMRKMRNPEGACKARMYIAQAYFQHERCDEALKNLEEMKRYAEVNNKQLYLAHALRFMGEYHLNDGKAATATELLKKSFEIFKSHDEVVEMKATRNLVGISAGTELFPYFADLIVKCDKKKVENEYLMDIVRWKDTREKFWERKETVLSENSNIVDGSENEFEKKENPTE